MSEDFGVFSERTRWEEDTPLLCFPAVGSFAMQLAQGSFATNPSFSLEFSYPASVWLKKGCRFLCWFCSETIPTSFWNVTFQLNKLLDHTVPMPQKPFSVTYYKSRTDTDLLTAFQRHTFGWQGCRWDFNSVELSGNTFICYQNLSL